MSASLLRELRLRPDGNMNDVLKLLCNAPRIEQSQDLSTQIINWFYQSELWRDMSSNKHPTTDPRFFNLAKLMCEARHFLTEEEVVAILLVSIARHNERCEEKTFAAMHKDDAPSGPQKPVWRANVFQPAKGKQRR